MATKIKLMRLGKMRAPHYRIVVADARKARNGRSIETIGKYEPKRDPSFMEVDSERAQYWLAVGAQPTDAVAAILKVTGDWQKFKGLPAPEPMKVAEPRPDRKAAFEAASRNNTEAAAPDTSGATTPRRRRPAAEKPAEAKPDDAKPDDAKPADAKPADATPAAETPAAETPTDETPTDETPAEKPAYE